MSDIWFLMDKALECARRAAQTDRRDIPVGCVIVSADPKAGVPPRLLASAWNTREAADRVTGHAELNALDAAAAVTGSRFLRGCKMFVTLEPCPMCAGAIRAAQIGELYFGAYNLREGAAGTVYNILYPYVKVYGGIRKDECASLLKKYFTALRG